MNCPVPISECFYTNASEFARGLKDYHFQLMNPVPAPISKHATIHVSKQVPSPSTDTSFREPGKGADLCSGAGPLPPQPTGRELGSLAGTQPLSPRHNQKRIVWAVPRHSHYPPFPYILQIIPPFANTQFSLPPQTPFTSTTTPTFFSFPLSFCVRGRTRRQLGSAAPPPRRQVPKWKACRHFNQSRQFKATD